MAFGSSVKAVQRGSVTFGDSVTATDTITAVVLAKSVLSFSHSSIAGGHTPSQQDIRGQITDTTTLTFTRTTADATELPVIEWQVIEHL